MNSKKKKKMINSVASSLLNGRNIKYHFLFAICNVLLRFWYLAYKQKTCKGYKDDYEERSILFYSGKRKRPCPVLASIHCHAIRRNRRYSSHLRWRVILCWWKKRIVSHRLLGAVWQTWLDLLSCENKSLTSESVDKLTTALSQSSAWSNIARFYSYIQPHICKRRRKKNERMNVCRPRFIFLLFVFPVQYTLICIYRRHRFRDKWTASFFFLHSFSFVRYVNIIRMQKVINQLFEDGWAACFFLLWKCSLPDITSTTTKKIQTKFQTTGESCVNISKNQNIECERIECRMTIIVHVKGFISSNTISNTKYPSITEEKPNKKKYCQSTLCTTS